MSNLEVDTRTLIERLVLAKDNFTAWEKWDETGWGKDDTQSFLHRYVAAHATHCHDKLKKYHINPYDMTFVEIHWAENLNSPHFTLNRTLVYDIVHTIH